jgi:diguanylate cyclase (GGDEF)-like protein
VEFVPPHERDSRWVRYVLRHLEPTLTASRKARTATAACAVLAMVLIGELDHASGRYTALTVAYLVPVVVIAWVATTRYALAAAAAAAAIQTTVENFKGGRAPDVLAWNGTARLAVYAFAALAILVLRYQFERERESARVDALTGLPNRRGFADEAQRLLALTARAAQPLALAFVDLDALKTINDRHGHAAGDDALVALAQHLVRAVRTSDVVARLGGDEFAVLLPGSGTADLDAFRARLPGRLDTPSGVATYSVGIATSRGDHDDIDAIIARADAQMYAVKPGRRPIAT